MSTRETWPLVPETADSARDALLRDSGAPITARPTWWSAWVRAFGGEPLVIALPGHRAMAPLAVSCTRGTTQIKLLGGAYADHARLPTTDSRAARELADLVAVRLSEMSAPWHLRFDHLPAQDPVAQRLAEVLPGCHWRLAPDRASPYVRLDPGTSVEDYLGRTSRKSHRRTARAFARAGGAVDHLQDPDQLRELLPKMASIRRARDHQFDRLSDLDSRQGYAFWSSVILDHADRGELEVAIATTGDAVVGYDVVLLDGRTERLWDGRIAPRAEALAVGTLLQDVALTRALHRGATELDLMRGVTPAKLRLATDVRVCSVLEAWSGERQRRLAVTSRAITARARRARDSHEQIDRLWRSVKRRTLLARADDDREGRVAS